MPVGHLRKRLCHLAGEALELARLLVGRIDEDEPASLLCRDEGVQRRPAVEMEHLDLRVAPEAPRQDRLVLGVELDENRPVLRPHELAHDQRRARIGVAVALPHRREDRPVGRDQRLDLGREGLAEPVDAAAPFLRPLGRVGAKVVEPGAGMRVDRPERRRLELKMDEDARQDDVLHHVGEVAGVEGVAIVHEPLERDDFL